MPVARTKQIRTGYAARLRRVNARHPKVMRRRAAASGWRGRLVCSPRSRDRIMTILLWLAVAALILIGLAGTILPALPGAIFIVTGIALGASIDAFARVPVWQLASSSESRPASSAWCEELSGRDSSNRSPRCAGRAARSGPARRPAPPLHGLGSRPAALVRDRSRSKACADSDAPSTPPGIDVWTLRRPGALLEHEYPGHGDRNK